MGSWTRRERTTRYTEFLVPLNSYADEFDRAWSAARDKWRDVNGESRNPPDDWCRIDADDEHVIIRIEVTEVRVA